MRTALALGIVTCILGGVPVGAETPQDVANDVSANVMSPYCPGVTLHDCPSDAAMRLRERIVMWAERGWSEDRIVDHLEEQWGVAVRATPPAEGLGLIAWLAPLAALLAGGCIAVPLARRWSRRRAAREPARELTEDERRRLDREMRTVREQF